MHALQTLFRSGLPFDEVQAIAAKRREEFAAVRGLVAQQWLQDPTTGEISALLVFAGRADAEAYLASDLRKGLGRAFGAEGTPLVRKWNVFA